MTLKAKKSKVIIEEESDEHYESTADSDNSGDVSEVEEDKNNSDGSVGNESSEQSDNDESRTGNAGWADSITKILKTNKPKGKKALVLSKAKKLSDVKLDHRKLTDFEIEGEDGQVKREKLDPLQKLDAPKSNEQHKKRKRERKSFRVKPNILEKDRERTLMKVATKGVVQLFNTVRMQQKDINVKLKEAGPLEVRKEKVLKNIDKRAFLNVLMGEKSQSIDLEQSHTPSKQSSSKNIQTWSVLREDFMMGAKLKDWDKELEEEMEADEVECE